MEVAPWRDSPLAGLFDAEIFSCAVGCVKPEPAIFEQCLLKLGLTGAECLYVGDGGSDELVGARAAGMSPVFLSGVMAELWPERIPERLAQCDHHVTRVPELLALPSISFTRSPGGSPSGPISHGLPTCSASTVVDGTNF